MKLEIASYRGKKRRAPRILLALLLLVVLAFGLLEAAIYTGARTELSGEPTVMVIFGCQVKPWGPSVLLQDRLDTALSYLKDHPDMTVVVSGGKGDDEHLSEAQCMYDYLTAHGVAGERILREDRSRDTWENVSCTMETLARSGQSGPADVVLVSSGFHLTRIRLLWDRGGGLGGTVSTLAAPVSDTPSAVQMFFREPLALIKSFLFDR